MSRPESVRQDWDRVVQEVAEILRKVKPETSEGGGRGGLGTAEEAWQFELRHMAAFGVKGILTAESV